MPSLRLQIVIFCLSFVTFGWFHQGGGWNQNARFAEVRAIVEQGTFAVDDYMVYRPVNSRELVRPDVTNGEFVYAGKLHRLCWGRDEWDYDIQPVNGRTLDDGAIPVVIGWNTMSGDVGVAPDGHFHPNKPPGASLLGVPVYWALYNFEWLCGVNADDWRVMTVNAWLVSALTVGLLSALGVVVFLRLCWQMFPGKPGACIAATLVFGFGTTYFPFGTLMFDHNLTAVLLLMAFSSARSDRPFSGGLLAGFGAVTNYLSAIPGAIIALYILLKDGKWSWKRFARFSLGVLPCFIGLMAYNYAAFGSLFTVNTSFQNPIFKETAPAFLGMFTLPSWFSTVVITVTPWRGLFWLSPILILSLVILCFWCLRKTFRAERWVIVGIALFFFLVNICFNGFHGGFAAGPRYLIPTLPFLCLPLVEAFSRWKIGACVLGMISVVQQSLLTITDAQNPLAVGSHAWVDHPGEWVDKLWNYSLVGDYAWPLFWKGRAEPIIDRKFAQHIEGIQKKLEKEIADPPERQKQFEAIKADALAKVERGEEEPLWIAAMPGPVSVNVMGVWEGSFFQMFAAHSQQANWASFNVGELLWPQSRKSLMPLCVLWVAGLYRLRREFSVTRAD